MSFMTFSGTISGRFSPKKWSHLIVQMIQLISIKSMPFCKRLCGSLNSRRDFIKKRRPSKSRCLSYLPMMYSGCSNQYYYLMKKT